MFVHGKEMSLGAGHMECHEGTANIRAITRWLGGLESKEVTPVKCLAKDLAQRKCSLNVSGCY